MKNNDDIDGQGASPIKVACFVIGFCALSWAIIILAVWKIVDLLQ